MVTEVVDIEPSGVIVYVDQSTHPVSTVTLYQTLTENSNVQPQSQAPSSSPGPSYAPPASSAASSPYAPPASTPTSSYAAPSSTTPQTYAATSSATPIAAVASSSSSGQYQVASSSTPAPPTQSSSPEGSLVGLAITYSPYQDNKLCKTWDQMKSELGKISGYQTIRIYGTDCDQVAAVLDYIKDNSMQLFAGIYDITQVDLESSRIIAAVQKITKGDWKSVHTVSVGNELINDNKASVDQITNALVEARKLLQKAGYNGKIVTVDTMNAVYDHPELCGDASDYCAINCHPFLADKGPVSAEGAGDYVAGWAYKVSTKIPHGKQIVVTETGWPTQGDTNNNAVASKKDQAVALESLKSSNMSSNMVLLTAYNDGWKSDGPGTFNAEKFWGII